MTFKRNVVAFSCFAVIVMASISAESQAQRHPFNIIPPKDFLRLTNDYQVAYISGFLEGMLFAASADDAPDVDKWAACAGSKSVGDTTDDVIAFLKGKPEFAEDMPSALAQTIGRRCKH